ncbi:sphingoid long-chain base transporter RSB1 [Penicillium angulare]|uniref:Sphingoid long-chain base transporter RSB1 n=1 Tax=Penicillium angulare TaxID=116970 RepID=A0A9W9K1F4_9EURO|nr:sphingoid long-chain base transporter RSB1 [Penicillium angulare]
MSGAAGQDDSQYLVSFGPDANCTLALCPVESSLQGYRPTLSVQIAFMALFGVSMLIHLVQGIRYRTWFFASMLALGCIGEIIGYGGRVMLYQNPFSFNGFIIEICCITISPVFFAAAIYVSLAKVTNYLGSEACRFPVKVYVWVFVPCDIVSLILQAVGGALSSSSVGSDKSGEYITIAGLVFQVFTLAVFTAMALDYLFRYMSYRKSQQLNQRTILSTRLGIFGVFFSASIIFILIRCCYRIAELSQGYSGSMFHDQPLFIVLESVMVILAVFALNIAQPGFAFQNRTPEAYAACDQNVELEPSSEHKSTEMLR